MTTVAWDGVTLAADQQQTRGSVKTRSEKLRRLSDGSLLAGAGTCSYIELIVRWIEAGEKYDDRPATWDDDDTATVLRVMPDGSLVEYDNYLVRMLVSEPRYAIGSGSDFAQAILDRGGSAREAVEAGIARDIYSGYGVSEMRLEPVRKGRRHG
jgi:20S proteasome alpha/beta subunit